MPNICDEALFWNSEQLKAVNYFLKKTSITDAWGGPKLTPLFCG